LKIEEQETKNKSMKSWSK